MKDLIFDINLKINASLGHLKWFAGYKNCQLYRMFTKFSKHFHKLGHTRVKIKKKNLFLQALRNIQIHTRAKFHWAKSKTEEKDISLTKSKFFDKFRRKRINIQKFKNQASRGWHITYIHIHANFDLAMPKIREPQAFSQKVDARRKANSHTIS